jgi:hypothetical protein
VVTLTNTGTGPLDIYSIYADSGYYEGAFSSSDTCPRGDLPPGQSCTITVSYTPSGGPGSDGGALFVYDSAGPPGYQAVGLITFPVLTPTPTATPTATATATRPPPGVSPADY